VEDVTAASVAYVYSQQVLAKWWAVVEHEMHPLHAPRKRNGVLSSDQDAQVIGLLPLSPSMEIVYPRSPELQLENAEVEIAWH